MHVLHFYKNALPESYGGVEQVIDQIACGTSALGVKNTVLTLSDFPSDISFPFHGYEIFNAKRNFQIASNGFSWNSINLYRDLAAKADLIHYHFPWPFADLIHQLFSPKKPTVLTYHSDIVRQKFLLRIYRPLMQQFLKSIDHIVATSPNYLYSSSILQGLNEKTSIIPIGLNDHSYSKPDISAIRQYKKILGERFFLFIGAFRYYKGLQFLIEAASIVP
jgi:rhamnosyl/mannosyltransferase